MYLGKEVLIEDRNFKRWLFIIAYNLLFYKRKHFVRYPKIVVKEENLYYLNIPKQFFFETVKDAYTITKITNITKSFEDEYRIPYLMYVSGYKYEEIAETLNLPIGIVKSRIFYAHYKLQSILKNHLL